MAQNLLELNAGNIAKGNKSQLMVCIIVDTSYSMMQENRIDIVNEGIQQFVEDGKNDISAADALDLCLISCGGTEAKVVREFKNVCNGSVPMFKAEGGTPMANAVELAIDRINMRRTHWINNGIGIYKPWLIIMSDGQADSPQDDLNKAARKVHDLYDKRKLKSMCIAIGNETDYSDLAKFSSDGTIKKMSALDIKEFFNKLSMSVAQLSTSTPDSEEYENEIF